MPNISSNSNVYAFKETVFMSEEEIKEYERKKAKEFKKNINSSLYGKTTKQKELNSK